MSMSLKGRGRRAAAKDRVGDLAPTPTHPRAHYTESGLEVHYLRDDS